MAIEETFYLVGDHGAVDKYLDWLKRSAMFQIEKSLEDGQLIARLIEGNPLPPDALFNPAAKRLPAVCVASFRFTRSGGVIQVRAVCEHSDYEEDFRLWVAESVLNFGGAESGTEIEQETANRGRPKLTPRELRKREDVVKKVLEVRDEHDITLEQACAREVIAYPTFKTWQRKLKQEKGK